MIQAVNLEDVAISLQLASFAPQNFFEQNKKLWIKNG